MGQGGSKAALLEEKLLAKLAGVESKEDALENSMRMVTDRHWWLELNQEVYDKLDELQRKLVR